jgi:integrase
MALRKAERDAVTKAETSQLSFRQAAQQYYDLHQHKWTSAEHRRQFLSSLEGFAYPVIGDMPVDMIDTPLVLKLLKRNDLWTEKHVTASRVRGRVESVLGWATVSGYRSGDNPARWRGHLKEALPAKGKKAKVHHPAMPYVEVPAFMASLARGEGNEVRALELLILTAARTSEVIKARRSEIDFDKKVWTIPAGRIKGRREHRVPLVDRAIQILKNLPKEKGDYLFIGARKGTALGQNSMAKLIEDRDDITIHGFRSSFRDYCEERTNFPRGIVEECLAHKTGGDTELSYKRSDVLEKRRRLMNQWATFCATPTRDASVTPIRKRA